MDEFKRDGMYVGVNPLTVSSRQLPCRFSVYVNLLVVPGFGLCEPVSASCIRLDHEGECGPLTR